MSFVKSDITEAKILNLSVVTLTERNKRYLLWSTLKELRRTTNETQTILDRLAWLHPPTARNFTIKTKTIFQAPLRLLVGGGHSERHNSISCSSESFIALSYCWHGPDWKPSKGYHIRKDSQRPISDKMLKVLLSQRLSDGEGIWIDALCIDQKNALEKTHAIASMDTIYKSARLIVIILEDAKLSVEQGQLLCEFIDDFSENEPISQSPFDKKVQSLLIILIRILSARWFKRAWCSHEFQTSTNHKFMIPVGNRVLQIKSEDLDALYWYSRNFLETQMQLGGWIREAWIKVTTAYDIVLRQPDNLKSASSPSPLFTRSIMAVFHDVFELDAPFEEDKISIAINLSGLQLCFTASGLSSHQCRWTVAMLALATGDASVLGGVGDTIDTGYNSDAISWLRWIDDLEPSGLYGHVPSLMLEPDLISVDPIKITLDVAFGFCSLHHAKVESLARATRFLDHCLAINDLVEKLGNAVWALHPDTKEYQDERSTWIDILACSIDCGLQWILDTTKHHKIYAQELGHSVKIPDFDLGPAIHQYLLDGFPDSSQSLIESTENKDLLIIFLFKILITSLPLDGVKHVSGLRLKHIRFKLGATCQGIMLDPTPFYIEGRKQIIAIPALLSSSHCETIRRLWLLQARHNVFDGTWTIAAKFALCGHIDLEEFSSQTILRKGQIIYGERMD